MRISNKTIKIQVSKLKIDRLSVNALRFILSTHSWHCFGAFNDLLLISPAFSPYMVLQGDTQVSCSSV